MGRMKANKPRRERRSYTGRPAAEVWDALLSGRIGPATNHGRVVTPGMVAKLKAAEPDQVDAIDAWAVPLLEMNAPFLEHPELLAELEELCVAAAHACPECPEEPTEGE